MPYSFSIQSKVVRSTPGAPLLVRTATHPRHRTSRGAYRVGRGDAITAREGGRIFAKVFSLATPGEKTERLPAAVYQVDHCD
jgi:hypothetical protein